MKKKVKNRRAVGIYGLITGFCVFALFSSFSLAQVTDECGHQNTSDDTNIRVDADHFMARVYIPFKNTVSKKESKCIPKPTEPALSRNIERVVRLLVAKEIKRRFKDSGLLKPGYQEPKTVGPYGNVTLNTSYLVEKAVAEEFNKAIGADSFSCTSVQPKTTAPVDSSRSDIKTY